MVRYNYLFTYLKTTLVVKYSYFKFKWIRQMIPYCFIMIWIIKKFKYKFHKMKTPIKWIFKKLGNQLINYLSGIIN